MNKPMRKNWSVKNPLLLWVKWKDARAMPSQWMWSSGVNPVDNRFQLVEIQTTGWLVFEDAERIIVASSMTLELDEEGDRLFSSGGIIPKSAIIERQYIE